MLVGAEGLLAKYWPFIVKLEGFLEVKFPLEAVILGNGLLYRCVKVLVWRALGVVVPLEGRFWICLTGKVAN